MLYGADKPLRLYVDPAWNKGGMFSPLMYSLWGNPNGEESLAAKELFDSYPLDARQYRITSDLSDADMVFPPYRHQWLLRHDPDLLDECVQVAREANLTLLIDGVGDIEYPLGFDNAYVLRVGGYRFLPERCRIQIPLAVDDLLERCVRGQLQLREKREGEKPVVGFAGWARMPLRQKARTFVKELPVRIRGVFDSRYRACTKGVWWRERAVQILRASPLVESNFLIRGSFSGSSKTAEGDLRRLQREFVDNLLASDYGLCIRGDANASNRLFETLALGRIPVILDTECILPFWDKVDYRSFALIVDFRDLGRLPEKIAEFHKNISPERFTEMQRNARDAFVNYFRTDALMPHILEELEKRESRTP